MQHYVRSILFVSAVTFLGASRCTTDKTTGTAQGWSEGQRVAWYTASQGSRLVPRAWIDALEQPTSMSPFLAADYIASFRYIGLPPGQWTSPDPSCPFDKNLPLGFTVDCQSDSALAVTKLRWKDGQSEHEPWVGMNCSACHTTQLTYQGKSVVIDGAPTLADFQSFTEALQNALVATADTPDKFKRFADAVLGAGADSTALKAALTSLTGWNDNLAKLNDPTVLRYGFGRLDAIGHIFNKVALEAAGGDAARQVANPSDAPVSYPFLWNVPQLDRVEWNGIAPNSKIGEVSGHEFNYGGMGRNTGEVIGVFGDVTLTSRPDITTGYRSSIDVTALNDMETQLASLAPPTWPADFPKPDAALVKTGQALFATQCAACHTVPSSPSDLSTRYTTTLQRAFPAGPDDHTAVGTDMWMACNAVLDKARSGIVVGNKSDFFGPDTLPVYGSSFTLVQNAVTGTLLGHKYQLVAAGVEDLFGFAHGLPQPGFVARAAPGVSPKDARRAACLSFQQPTPPNIVYKGRPLQGIWATAPYLHDGSVPTLYDLLLPPAQRPTKFYMGSREFDPVKVGYVTAKSAENSFEFDTVDSSGKPIDGNSNAGHDYGNAARSEGDREALVEYMKTL